MKSVDGTPTQKFINAGWRESRQRLRYLEQFSDTLPQLNLTSYERDHTKAQRMLHAAKLCITRGQLRMAQSLLTRAYSSASRLHACELALDIAHTRVELENVLQNVPAMRLWSKRAYQWNSHLEKTSEERIRARVLFYESVLCTRHDSRKTTFNQYVCDELRHIILPYQYCSLGRYTEARSALDADAIVRTSSVYLHEESMWLRFRICCSQQRYQDAKACIAAMGKSIVVTRRIQDYVRIGQAYCDLIDVLYCEDAPLNHRSIDTAQFIDSFNVVQYETSGMFLSVLVYELAHLLMSHQFATADKRLAALRSRIHRLQADEFFEELRVFIRVAAYVLATSHLYKRTLPRKLLGTFHSCSSYVPYPQQGIIPYSELAYRLLRYLDYR